MRLKEKRIKVLRNLLNKSDYLLEISDKILNRLNRINFDYSEHNLLNLYSVLENTFNYNFNDMIINLFSDNYYEIFFNKYFSVVYRYLNILNSYLKDIIKCYSKYINNKNDILLNLTIKSLKLDNNHTNDYKFFLNYNYSFKDDVNNNKMLFI